MSVITLCNVFVKSVTRLCRLLARLLAVLAALLAVVLALGLAVGAARALLIDERLAGADAIGRLPATGVVDGTVRSSNLSSVRGGRHEESRLCRRFW
jgi:hypothetical protein